MIVRRYVHKVTTAVFASALAVLSLVPTPLHAIAPLPGCVAGNDAFTYTDSHPQNNLYYGVVNNGDSLAGPDGTRYYYAFQNGRTAAGGRIIQSVHGWFEYLAPDHFVGTDSFSYSIYPTPAADTEPCATATVTLTMNVPDYVQLRAADDTATTDDTRSVAVTPAANDLHALTTMTSQLTVSNLTNLTPDMGTFVQSGSLTNATVTFTPFAGKTGVASASYQVSDAYGNTSTATIRVSVSHINQAPIATNDSFTTPEDVALTGNVLANDTDPERDPLTVILITGPQSGSLNLQPNGTFTYTPAANSWGSDWFTYRISDGQYTSTATVFLTVTSVNDAPTATFASQVGKNRMVSFDASASTDIDSSIASYSWNFGDGTTGTGTFANHTYKKAGNYTVTLTVTDSLGAASTSTQVVKIGK
ncbi:MAG: Ig-like domain-containing protein [Candidatus Saccharimonadales bacterium]